MNVWVTGANGFIGRHLVRVLADRGYRVHGIGHGAIGETERHRLGLEHWLNGEIDAANLNALAEHSGLPSTIFHLAGGSSVGLSIAQPFEDFSRTVASTARLLEWLRSAARDCRLIVVSSAAVYGADHEGPIGVDAATLPMSPYGQHKLMMEQLCRSYAVTFGLHSTVARLFSVYGPNLRKQLPWDICSRLQAGERKLVLGGTGAEVRDWTDVRDVVRLLVEIDERPQVETFQVINGGSAIGTTVARVAAILAKCWGGSISVQYSGIVRAGDPASLLSDDTMMRTLPFDWTIPVEQGLADYVSWFKDQIPVNPAAPVRLAFTHIPRRVWAGGYNYQSNLFAALSKFRPGEFAPVLFAGIGDEADLAPLAAIPGVEVIRSAAFDSRAGLVAALALGLDCEAAAEFRTHRIDAVFESARFFGWRLPYPAIAWFPDFQHRRLPQLFPAAARWRREAGFRMQIASGRTVMLSSESSHRDFRKFYPGAKNEVCVVRFATGPSPAFLNANPAEIVAQYQLPEKYFYLPNQFYTHKNHQVVVDALAILAQRGFDVVVCASGSTEDRRERGYFDEVMERVRSRGLERRFRHLGMIPLSHVYALLRACAGLINPSRSEGWSTTVEEAKSFGVPMILSDLDVHREQTTGTARYFGTDDPTALADHLMRVAQDSEVSIIRNLVPHQDHRVAAFAADFVNTVQCAIQVSQR